MDHLAYNVGNAVCEGYKQIDATSLWVSQCNIWTGGNPTTVGYIAIFIAMIVVLGSIGGGVVRK
jgi:hypothetical protein